MAGSSAGDVRRALEAALRRLERLHDPLSVQECRAAGEAAGIAATTATEIRRGNVAALAGLLAGVGPLLEALDPLLTSQLAATPDDDLRGEICALTHAIARLYAGCWHVADPAQLSRAQQRQLSRGTLLLIGAGRAALAHMAAMLPAGPSRSETLRDVSQTLLQGLALARGHGDSSNPDTMYNECAAVGQAPPEQGLVFLATVSELAANDPALPLECVARHCHVTLLFLAHSPRHQPTLARSARLQRALLQGLTRDVQVAAAELAAAGTTSQGWRSPHTSSRSRVEEAWFLLSNAASCLLVGDLLGTPVRHALQQGSAVVQLLRTLMQLSLSPVVEPSASLSAEQLAAATRMQMQARPLLRQAAFSIVAAACQSIYAQEPSPECISQLVSTALQLVQEAAGATPRLLAEQQAVELNARVEGVCSHGGMVASLLRLAYGAQGTVAVQLPASAAAALAALQLLQQFSALDGATAGQEVLEWTTSLLDRLRTSGTQESSPATASQLWQAHTLACRLVHDACCASHLSSAQPVVADRTQLLRLLSISYFAAIHALPDGAEAQVRALVAGHAEALLALSSHMSVRAMAANAREWADVSCEPSAGLVLLAYITCDLLSAGFLVARAPQLAQLAGSIAKWARQRREGSAEEPGDCTFAFAAKMIVEEASRGAAAPQAMALLFTSGLLATLLEGAALEQERGGEDNAQVNMADRLQAALTALLDRAAQLEQPPDRQADPSEPPAATPQPLPAELAARLAAARQRLAVLLAEHSPQQLMRRFADQVQPAAAELGAALLAYWQLPQQRAAAGLELAQAAAGRSCAYLRCANLAAAGGPEAGEGVGSMRCSACRAVWYCGPACSHPDWRAGHRHVCTALGAARRAAKQAAAAAGVPA